MAECARPPRVFTVETYSSRPPPLPPKPTRRAPAQRGGGRTTTLLFLLVGLALCGMVVEAYCIFRLSKNTQVAPSGSTSKLIAGESKAKSSVVRPSKPTAHLTYQDDVAPEPQLMRWRPHVLHRVFYNNSRGSLVIQREGYYYVYSKVAFRDTRVFRHAVRRRTGLYGGPFVPLLVSRKYLADASVTEMGSSNSYLGGVFHLQAGDAVYVEVSDTSKLLLLHAYEHVFGAYML